MASNQSTALKHWARILKRWPVDRVRPDKVSFQKLMQRRPQQISLPSNNTKGPTELTKENGNQEMQQVNALYTLLEDRYAKRYPLPTSLRQPASNPTYYDDLVQEMQEAPTRSWLGSLKKRISGSLRFT